MSTFPVQTQSFSLFGSGATVGDTTLALSSFNDINGNPLQMSSFGSIGFGTIEPNNGTQEDSITFSGITPNANGTVTLTGVQSVGFLYPYTASVGLAVAHAGSTTFIITNTSYFYYSTIPQLSDDEVITGNWQVPDPVSAKSIANKEYVLSVVSGGPISFDQEIVAGTAGHALAVGNICYLFTDGRWYLASASAAATSLNYILGICQTIATTGNPTTILVSGQDQTQSGLTTGATYYISNTAGNLSSTPGATNIAVGVAISATALDFQPNFITTNAIQTGMIFDFGGTTAPTGYLLCDGSAVSRTTYANLFTIIATAYGAGDGSTTFNVPDFRSRSIIGAGTGTKIVTISSITGNVFTVTGLTNAANNEFQTGQAIVAGTTSGNIVAATTYYVIRVTNTTFSIATTLANAQNNVVKTLAETETGTFTLTFATRTVGDTGGEENHAMSSTELLAHVHFLSLPAAGSGGGITGFFSENSASTPTSEITTSEGGNVAMNVMVPFGVATKIIKI